jgi:hypothetical protein
MKFIKNLLGKQDDTPTWDIKPQAERPASRKETVFDEPLPSTKPKEKDLFLDDEKLDTMQLEADAEPEDNPYQTMSWEEDLENDTRKMKTIQIGDKSDKPVDNKYNPYDTGSMRRGWKK